MHSFLSKVFGRKKDDKETSPTTLAPGELLDGRFEAVSPNVSPSATHFLELDPKANGHSKEAFTFFRAKSRPASPEIKKPDTLPHLSLNFSEFKDRPDLDAEILLTDAVIGQRRLNPLEALVLIRACSQAIIARGLETLGIMHPHWYSSSPEIQRRLISHFLNSLAPQSAISPLSPTLSSPISAFESEVHFTRNPHDVATVLRWGLRHLQLEGDHFGTDDGWYKAFLDAESAAEYPPKAFSEKLAPNLPPAHLELLIATLEIFSSLAAHSEANSTNGSKLSKIFGLWLLTARRVEDKDDWQSFYSRWERTGRMLEHLFLARIRDESTDQRMPVRLLELVRKYPYTQGLSSPTTDLQLLSRPRFTTSLYDALFVRIEFEYPTASRKPKVKIHPLNLLADAFSASLDSAEHTELWAKITAASKNGSDPSPLSNIFADETIRFLSLVSNGKGKENEAKSPTFSILPLSPPTSPVKRSFSTGDEPSTSTAAVEPVHAKSVTDPAPVTPISPLAIGSDWAQFSSSGFLDSSPAIVPLVSTLFDTDIEKTVPPEPPVQTLSRKSSRRAQRKSVDVPRTIAIADSLATDVSSAAATEVKESGPTIKATKLEIIQFDEAFIDFWSDSLLDPITSKWPTFIICKFKSTLVPQLTYGKAEEGKPQKTLNWLILEQVYTVKPPPAPAPLVVPPTVDPDLTEAARPSSPTTSTSGKRRWFWSISRTPSGSSATSMGEKDKGKRKTPKISEMGELLEEEGGKVPSSPTKNRKSIDFGRKSVDQKVKPAVDQGKKSLDQKPVAQQAVVEASATNTAVVAAAAVVATGASVLAAVPEDRPVEGERVQEEKAVLVTDADVKVSALPMPPGLHPQLFVEPVPTEVAANSEPISITKVEQLSNPLSSEAEVIAPVINQEEVVEAKTVEVIPAAIEEQKVGAEAVKEVGIVPAVMEEEQAAEPTKEEVEEKSVEGEEVKEKVVPAAIEEEKSVDAQTTKEEDESIPAAIDEKAIDTEPSKEELIVEPVVSPSDSLVETEKPVEPEVAKEEVVSSELVTLPIVEVEEVQSVEAVAPAVEEEKFVEAELTEEEVTITEPIVQPPLGVEAPPVAGPIVLEQPVLEQPALEENKSEEVETSTVAEPIATIEEAVIPVLTAEDIKPTEDLPVVEPSVDIQPATEAEAVELAKQEEISADTEVDTEVAPIVEELVEPISVPADSASEDVVVVEQEETAESQVSETLLAPDVEEEASPELEQEVSAVPSADVHPNEEDVSVISTNVEVDVEDEKEGDVSVEGFSVVPVPEPTTANEDWEEVLAVSETEPAIQGVQQEVEEVPVVSASEIRASDEEGVIVESGPAVQVAEEKAEEYVALETEIVPRPPTTDDLAEAKKEDVIEQKVEVVEEVMAKEVEAEAVDEVAEEATKEVQGKADEMEKAAEVEVPVEEGDKVEIADEVSKADKVEDEADKVEKTTGEAEQELQGPVVAAVVIPEVEEASEPAYALEDLPKSDAVVVEKESLIERHSLVPQAPVEDTATPPSAQTESVVAPTEDLVSAISASLESTGNVQEENLEDISPASVEATAPAPPMEAASNDEEHLDVESEAVLEISEAKPEEPQQAIEETVPVDVGVEAEDEKVDVDEVDELVVGQDVKDERDPVEPETRGIIDEVEGRAEQVEDAGEQNEEVSAVGATLEEPAEETTLAVAENTAEFALETAVAPAEVSKEKGEEPVAAIEEETASGLLATQPLQASSQQFVENVEDSVALEEEELVLDTPLSDPTLDLSSVMPGATEGVVEQLEELVVPTIQDENTPPLAIPESVEEVGGKMEGIIGIENTMATPEDEAPFHTVSDVSAQKTGVEEEVPASASEVPLEAPLEESAALHDETSTPTFALEAEATNEAAPVELFDPKEEDAIVEPLAPEHPELGSVDSNVAAEEKEIPIPEQELEPGEVEQAEEATMTLEENISAASVPVEVVESAEVIEASTGEVIEGEAVHSHAPISEVHLGASSETVEENLADETQLVEEKTTLYPESIAEPHPDAVEEVAAANEAELEVSAAHTDAPGDVVTSEFEPLAGAGEHVEAIEEVVPSSEVAIPNQTAEEPISTLTETEVAPTTVSNGNVEEKHANGINQATQADVEEDIGSKEDPVAEVQLGQHSAAESVALIETESASDTSVAPEASGDVIERALDMTTPMVEETVEETIEPVALGREDMPALEIPVEPILAVGESNEEEPNPTTAEEFPVPGPESPLKADENVGGFDHHAEGEAIVADEAEVQPHPDTSEEPTASIPSPISHEENSSPKASDPISESKDAFDTPAVLETLVRPEHVDIMPVAIEDAFENSTPDQHEAMIDDTIETAKIQLPCELDTPTLLGDDVASHDVPTDSKESPTSDSRIETDEQTENAPKASDKAVDPVLNPDISTEEPPPVGPSEMTSTPLDAPNEGTPTISALTTENGLVEESSVATHEGEYPSVVKEYVDQAPIADAVEPNVENGFSEMEAQKDIADDSVRPILEAEQSSELSTSLDESQAFVAEPISVTSELLSSEVPAVNGEETSILKDVTEADIELKREVSEPSAVDSLPQNQNAALEAATGVTSHDPASVTEPPLANEINQLTSVEGVSATTSAESSAPASEDQERMSIEAKDLEAEAPSPVLESEIGVDFINDGPPIVEKPTTDAETVATSSFHDVEDGIGNSMSQKLVSDTPMAEAELTQPSEEPTPLPAVELVLASASPLIEILAVPEAEESIIAAADDENSQSITEELVAEAETELPSVDPVIPALDVTAVCGSETTPAEPPSGIEIVSSAEVEPETVQGPVSPQEIDESTIDPSPIEIELKKSLTEESITIEAETVGESVPAEDPLVEDAFVQNFQHEESTTPNIQAEIVSESNLVGTFESQESIAAEELDTGPIAEEASAPVAEIVEKNAPSNENVVVGSKEEVEEPIVIDAPEGSLTVVELQLEAIVSSVDGPSLVDEPEMPSADADISEELTAELTTDGGIEHEVLEAAEESGDAQAEVETLDSNSVDVVDKAPEVEVVDLLDLTTAEHDTSEELEADPDPTVETSRAEAIEDSSSASVEVVPKELEPPIVEANGEPAPKESEAIAAMEESDVTPTVEEGSTPVAESQPINETALSFEEESTVKPEDPIAVPDPITEAIPAFETILESTLPLVEAPSVTDKPESPTESADVSVQPALIAEKDSTDATDTDTMDSTSQLAEEIPSVASEEPNQNESSSKSPDVALSSTGSSSANVVDTEVHAILEEEPTTVATENSPTPVPVSAEPTAAEAESSVPSNETPIESIQDSIPVAESAVAESMAPPSKGEPTTPNSQESTDVLTDVHEPIVIQEHVTSDADEPIHANDVIDDVSTEVLVADAEETLLKVTPEEKIDSGPASAPDVEADVEVAAEVGPVEDHVVEPEHTPIDSAPLESQTIEETSKVDEATTTHLSSAPIVGEEPIEAEGTALEPSAPEEATFIEHLTGPILDATTLPDEPIAVADVEALDVRDQAPAIGSPVPILEVDPLAEEQITVEEEPTFGTMPSVEPATPENLPAFEDTTAPETLVNNSLQESKSLVEGDSKVEDEVPVDGPTSSVVEPAPNDSAPLNIEDVEIEESMHLEATSEPAVQEGLPIVQDSTAPEIAPPSVVAEDGTVEASEHIAVEPAAPEAMEEPTESLETAEAENVAEISDSTIPVHEDLAVGQGPSPIVIEDAVVEENAAEHIADEPEAEPTEGAEEISAPTEELVTAAKSDPIPIHEALGVPEAIPPSVLVVEDGPVETTAVEHIPEELAAEPTEGSPAEGETVVTDIPAPTEEVTTVAEPDPTTSVHLALPDVPDPSPVMVSEDVAPVVEESTLHEPTAPEDPSIVEDTTATTSHIAVVEDGSVEANAAEDAESTEDPEPNTAEGPAEISAPIEEVVTEAPSESITPINDDLADNQDLSPIVVDEDVAPVEAEGPTLHESTVPEDLPIVEDTTATEVSPPSNIVVEDRSVETDEVEPVAPESAAVEGENVVATISAAIEEDTPVVEADPSPIHEDLIENEDPSPPVVVDDNDAPVTVEEPASLDATPTAAEDDVVKSLDVSSNVEATASVSAPEPNVENGEAEPVLDKLEIEEVVPVDLPTQENLTAVPALDISSQEFEDVIVELGSPAAVEVPVSGSNGHLASSDLGGVVDGSIALEDDKPVGLDQEMLAADETVAEVAAEVEVLTGNGHSEFSELDKEVSIEGPISNGHGHHNIDEVSEVPSLEVQLDSNLDNTQAEVSIGNGHDSKAHDVLLAPQVAGLPPPTSSAEADTTPAIETQ